MIRPSSITLGCAARPEFGDEVHDYCCANEIDFYKMEKDPMSYQLNKVPVLQFSSIT